MTILLLIASDTLNALCQKLILRAALACVLSCLEYYYICIRMWLFHHAHFKIKLQPQDSYILLRLFEVSLFIGYLD